MSLVSSSSSSSTGEEKRVRWVNDNQKNAVLHPYVGIMPLGHGGQLLAVEPPPQQMT